MRSPPVGAVSRAAASALPCKRPQDELLQRVQRPFQPARSQDRPLNQTRHDSAGVLEPQGVERQGEKSPARADGAGGAGGADGRWRVSRQDQRVAGASPQGRRHRSQARRCGKHGSNPRRRMTAQAALLSMDEVMSLAGRGGFVCLVAHARTKFGAGCGLEPHFLCRLPVRATAPERKRESRGACPSQRHRRRRA